MDTENTRFRKLREELNLSQEAFGEVLGLSRSGVTSIENGNRKLSNKHIKMLLVKHPNVNEEWLRTGEGEMLNEGIDPLTARLQAYDRDEIENRVLEVYLQLSVADKAVIKSFVKALIEPPIPPLTEEELIEMEVARYRQTLITKREAEKRQKPPDEKA